MRSLQSFDMKILKRITAAWLLAAAASLSVAHAQDAGKPPAAAFKPEELEALVAPIALYPDALVAQVLMAATYPLEIVEAARWSKANASLKGQALQTELQIQTWDPSVKSLAAFPQILQMMNDKLDMTQKLGDAFLAQQKDVMDAVQRLRARALAAGNLKSGKEQTVTTQQDGDKTIIIIEPTQTEVVYVPSYNATVVYGPWPYPMYPPYYYYPPGYPAGGIWFGFSVGIIIGGAWGGCNWRGGGVYINHHAYNRFNNTNINSPEWKHSPEHRKGAEYRDQASRDRFGGGQRQGAESREAFRGRAEEGQRDIARGGADSLRDGGPGSRGDRPDSRSDRGGAFDGVGGGADSRSFSDRGASSRGGGGFQGGGGFSGGGGRGGGGFGGGGRGGGGRR